MVPVGKRPSEQMAIRSGSVPGGCVRAGEDRLNAMVKPESHRVKCGARISDGSICWRQIRLRRKLIARSQTIDSIAFHVTSRWQMSRGRARSQQDV